MQDRQASPAIVDDSPTTKVMSFFKNILVSYFNDDGIKFAASTVVGVTLAVAFNPVDRALYLAQTTGRRFLSTANFSHPFEGFRAAMFQRIISGGSYFFLQGLAEAYIVPLLRSEGGANHYRERIGVGFCAGALNGLLLNPLSAIKSNMWSESERIRAIKTKLAPTEDKRHKNNLIKQQISFFKSSRAMCLAGGVAAFYRGLPAMVWRELQYSVPYEVTRYMLRIYLHDDKNKMRDFGCRVISDSIGGGVGAVAASVPNFVRSLQYHAPLHEKEPTVIECLITLNNKVMQAEYKFLTLRQTLCLGPGTGRVAISSALGQGLFKFVVDKLTDAQKQAQVEPSVKPTW